MKGKGEKSTVAVVPCRTYEPEEVRSAVQHGLALLGGCGQLFRPEENILLKPNLVRSAARERAVVTDPAVLDALIGNLKEAGYRKLTCGDSCGLGSTEGTAKACGLLDVLQKQKVPLTDLHEGVKTTFGDGKTMMVAKDALSADAIVSIGKMKTHALERITGAVKNQYGCISGMYKKVGHTEYPNAESFARMLVELNQILPMRLFVLDGIVAMEGNGPTSGDPTPMQVLLFSTDPVALDAVFCHLVYLDPKLVPTNVMGETLGLGTWREENIRIVSPDGELSAGELQKRYGNRKFRADRSPKRKKGVLDLLGVLDHFGPRPVIDPKLCRKCGICVESCPVEGKALHFPEEGREKEPVYDYKKCIRCCCCQEMCPHGAISLQRRGFEFSSRTRSRSGKKWCGH